MSTDYAQSASDAASAVALRLTPTLTVTAISLVAYLPSIVYVITAVVGLAQLYFLLRDKWWRERKTK